MSRRIRAVRLRMLAVCAMLEYAALVGSPMRPEEVQKLMQQFNQPQLAHALPAEEDDGGAPPNGMQ
jgi:hypothetical protein